MPPIDQVVLVGLRPPVEVALAKAVTGIPAASALPGETLFEPKVDGYRLVIFRAEGRSTLWSRHGKDLTRYFPELESAAVEMIPDGCVIDGEAVVWSEGRLNFEALQRRLSASRARLLAIVRAQPASFIGFDVLGVAGHDARNLPLKDRRALLEELATVWVPPLAVSPQTTDLEMAKEWFEDRAAAGYEGLVAKSSIQPYLGGKRIWLKSKKRSELDVVCGAVIGPLGRPTEIVAGLPMAGELRIVGRSSPLKPADSRALSRWLRQPVGTHPWPSTVKGTTLDRFNRDASRVELTLVEPVVVEVAADAAWSGRSFRHALRYLRTRPEIDPTAVEVPPRLHLNGS